MLAIDIMKKQIFSLDVLLRKTRKILIFFSFIFLLNPSIVFAGERWFLDKELSSITFELPVLLAKNVQGTFTSIEGFVEIDVDQKKNNKAIFFVDIGGIDMNYKKYKDLLLSNIFFDERQFPKVVIDTKKFTYQNEEELEINVELIIKGQSQMVPLTITVKRLAEELVQIQSELVFSRTDFNIGIGKWSNTTILRDKTKIKTNLFLFKE